MALEDAIASLIKDGHLTTSPIRNQIAAISVGLLEGDAFLDLNYPEDFAADIDFNVVMNCPVDGQIVDGQLEFIEVQGTAEAGSFTRPQLNAMLDYAEKGIGEVMQLQRAVLAE